MHQIVVPGGYIPNNCTLCTMY